jgi:hypothetical protein
LAVEVADVAVVGAGGERREGEEAEGGEIFHRSLWRFIWRVDGRCGRCGR